MERERTVIEEIIYLSKIIIALKLNKIQLEGTKDLANRIPVRLFTKKYYKEQIDENIERQLEISIQIKNRLRPLFQNKKFVGYEEDWKYWAFSRREMQQGFIRLELERDKDIYGNPVGPIRYYILFLSEYHDNIYNILEGSLYPLDQISPILSNQKDVFGNDLDINRYLYTLLDEPKHK